MPAYSSTDEPGALRGIDNVPVVPKFEIAVLGRTVLAGAVAGAATGAVVIPLVVLGDGLRRNAVDWGEFVEGVLAGFVSLGVVGALVGVAAGVVAGALLLLVAPTLAGRPRPVVRVVAALVCAGGFGVPILVVGLGWDLWLSGPWTRLAVLLMAIAAVVGAGRGPYLIDGPADRVRAAAGSE
jgi:hypothetical protein